MDPPTFSMASIADFVAPTTSRETLSLISPFPKRRIPSHALRRALMVGGTIL
jgi:hypothetical protein